MMRLLVSVRSVPEALQAAAGGADFIDLKEPGAGALGGLPISTIEQIVRALRERHPGLPISATIGDVAMADRAAILQRARAVGPCGVDYVKVGIENAPGAIEVLQDLAGCGHAVVPVFIADQGLDLEVVQGALDLGFPGVMADTAAKRAGSLFALLPGPALAAFVDAARARGTMVGLAGALRLPDLPRLVALCPDFAGFRSAVCDGERSAALSPARLAALVAAVRELQQAGEVAAHG